MNVKIKTTFVNEGHVHLGMGIIPAFVELVSQEVLFVEVRNYVQCITTVGKAVFKSRRNRCWLDPVKQQSKTFIITEKFLKRD